MSENNAPDVDVVVVGAGMAGLYLLHRFRQLGLTARAIESADDVGGTWYWNRYPGARCDIMSLDYSYSFDRELQDEWEWSEKYAQQPEILRYLQHVADRLDLRRDITFSTTVKRAVWDDAGSVWNIETGAGESITCRHYVMATGCLSMPKTVDIDGVEDFAGEVYWTSSWPHDGVDLSGKRVAVIGTGSSGIQSIPVMARECAAMTVYQRTANFSVPAHHGPVPQDKVDAYTGNEDEYREAARWSRGGVPLEVTQDMALLATPEERNARFEAAYAVGGIMELLGTYADLLISEEANELVAEFVRNKIRATVKDPATAELLCPTSHPMGTKRLCLDHQYFETYNLDHVDLIDLTSTPIETITEHGIQTAAGDTEFDVIVFATGFDAMTGAIVAVDIEGRNGVTLKDKWADGPQTYLGLMAKDFPNLFMITGPGSPSVLSNMAVSIEQHVEWVTNCIAMLRDEGSTAIEPTETAENGWQTHGNDCADLTLFNKADSWYIGANVPGKPRVLLPYFGGVDAYRQVCNEVAEQDYLGFTRSGAHGEKTNDGVIREIQPDVDMVLQMMGELGLPPLESMSPDDARAFMAASKEMSPPGPEVGEVTDGQYPGADGTMLGYRLYRPASPGPHPVVAYFHGGGWVLGSHDSDDALCRDLCLQSDTLIVSFDYRHAPEARFPASVDDGWAAVQWIADNAESLGGLSGQLAVAGWSAGANIAAVCAQQARDAGGPTLSGQVLLTPVVDCDMTRGSYVDNAEGYVLTAGLMNWFWGHYADEADRTDPKASPIRAESLADLPPAYVITADFDPLRDEGIAYVEALQAAGNQATHIRARGHTHTSVGMVGVILSGAPVRTEIAAALRDVLGLAAVTDLTQAVAAG